MRLGIFGGTFDPVHYGHLLLAEYCREQAGLDLVWFLPAAAPPHKTDREIAGAEDRIAMLELAVGGHPSFQVSRLEIDRGGVSYTYQTLEAVRDEDPSRELLLMMGADSLVDLPGWRNPRRICELALPLVVRRAGVEEPRFDALAPLMDADRLDAARQLKVDFPRMELSSTEIRRRVAGGLSIRYQTPRAVEAYIDSHGLYRQGS